MSDYKYSDEYKRPGPAMMADIIIELGVKIADRENAIVFLEGERDDMQKKVISAERDTKYANDRLEKVMEQLAQIEKYRDGFHLQLVDARARIGELENERNKAVEEGIAKEKAAFEKFDGEYRQISKWGNDWKRKAERLARELRKLKKQNNGYRKPQP